MRLVLLLALLGGSALADSSTPGTPRPGTPRPERLGRLTITVSPPGAIIFIDGKATDRALTDMSMRIPAGKHRVELRRGELQIRRDVEVLPDLTTFVRESL
jgi:hypothetical protein